LSVKPKFKAEEKKVNTTPRNISDAEMNFFGVKNETHSTRFRTRDTLSCD